MQAEYEPPEGERRNIQVSSEQLNGRACIVCGSHLDGLMDAGWVFTKAGDDLLPWRAKACPRHTPTEAAA